MRKRVGYVSLLILMQLPLVVGVQLLLFASGTTATIGFILVVTYAAVYFFGGILRAIISYRRFRR